MEGTHIFEIQDNENVYLRKNLMLYQIKDSLLNPLVQKFENGQPVFPSFENIILFLRENKIKNLITYHPDDLDTVCSHPYEIGDFTDDEIQYGACFHRFYHYEFSPSKEQVKILKENNIDLKHLNEKEKSILEKSLKYH